MQVIELFNKFNESLGSYIFSRWIGKFIEDKGSISEIAKSGRRRFKKIVE